eukprot:14068891-Heterocapsa_arctica.AAC.1
MDSACRRRGDGGSARQPSTWATYSITSTVHREIQAPDGPEGAVRLARDAPPVPITFSRNRHQEQLDAYEQIPHDLPPHVGRNDDIFADDILLVCKRT